MLLVGVGLVGAQEQGGRYLMIVADEFVDIVQPLAEWKTSKGMLAKVVPVSQAGGGTNPEAIRDFIRDAWENWPIPPEYVCIVGAPSYIRAPGNYYDGRYGDLAGDYKMEISVGRLPAENARECSVLVNKTLAYENPPWEDTLWFLKGTTTLREDHDANDSIYWNDSYICHNYWLDMGYVHIDSFSRDSGGGSAEVNMAATDGRSFITYRGQGVRSWWQPYNNITPGTWTNHHKMPVVVGATCATVTLAPYESMYGDQFVRAGSPDNLGGAIAYFGTTRSGSHIPRPRSNCFRGFFNSLFYMKNPRLGDATLVGRSWVQSGSERYEEWNLMGDPELNVWTGLPRHPEVAYDSVRILAPQTMEVTVRAAGQPFASAMVCVWMDSVVYERGLTNADGRVELNINPTHIGPMRVTVTGRNLLPFIGSCQITPGGVPYLVIDGMQVDDFIGNHDGKVNPGERFRLRLGLRNLGGVTATGVSALLRSSDPAVTLFDSSSTYGTVLPDSIVFGDAFELAVDTTVRNGYQPALTVRVTDSEGDTWTRPVGITVRAGQIAYVEATFLDLAPGGNNNGIIGAGESGRLLVALDNTGGGRLDGVRATLASLDTNVVVEDSTAFYGWFNPGDTLPGDYDAFGITAGPGLALNSTVDFLLTVHGDGGTYSYACTLGFELATEEATGGPTGPDAYGYWCYDDTDTASGRAPVFQWMGLTSIGTWIDSASTRDAAIVTRPLPFTFSYYGVDYDEISISSNGFLALGRETYPNGYNRRLPSTEAAAKMVCPFWDDLNPSDQGWGDAYLYYDETGHRFMVEFNQFAHRGQRNIRETFQAIFYDPAYHPSPTGDGDIVFMYNQVQNNSSTTLGIEDHTEQRGICYLYNNDYAPGAEWLTAGRAIRFTTFPPETGEAPWLVPLQVRVTDSTGNNNGLFEAGETLAVEVTVRNRGTAAAANAAAVLRSLEPDAIVMDSAAALGSIPAGGQASNAGTPFVFRVAELPEDSLLNFELLLTADGYQTLGYFSVGLDAVSGVGSEPGHKLLRTGLDRVRPNPVAGWGTIQYTMARGGHVDLALIDASGRRVMVLVRGATGAGRYAVPFAASRLSQGVYFVRLRVTDESGFRRFTRKVQIVR